MDKGDDTVGTRAVCTAPATTLHTRGAPARDPSTQTGFPASPPLRFFLFLLFRLELMLDVCAWPAARIAEIVRFSELEHPLCEPTPSYRRDHAALVLRSWSRSCRADFLSPWLRWRTAERVRRSSRLDGLSVGPPPLPSSSDDVDRTETTDMLEPPPKLSPWTDTPPLPPPPSSTRVVEREPPNDTVRENCRAGERALRLLPRASVEVPLYEPGPSARRAVRGSTRMRVLGLPCAERGAPAVDDGGPNTAATRRANACDDAEGGSQGERGEY